MFEADTASHALGIELLDLANGFARTRMKITDQMVNGHGITHGGYVFLVADTTFALACNSYNDQAVAARADIRYLRPTRSGDVLIATATERTRFGATESTMSTLPATASSSQNSAGIVMPAGLIYLYLIRPALKGRETQRLSSSNRSYLDTESPGDDYLNPPHLN